MAQRSDAPRPTMFGRLFRRTNATTTSRVTPRPHPPPYPPPSQSGVGGFFRRLFRRAPSTVHVQPLQAPESSNSSIEPPERDRVVPMELEIESRRDCECDVQEFISSAVALAPQPAVLRIEIPA